MRKRIILFTLLISMFIFNPAIMAAGGGGGAGYGSSGSSMDSGSGSASGGTNSTGDASTSGSSNAGTGSNNPSTSDKVQQTNQVSTQDQNREATGSDNAAGLLQQTRECLEVMLNERSITQEQWSAVAANLNQLKSAYQTRSELRQEIMNTFNLALQNAKAMNNENTVEGLLRDIISMEPLDSGAYKELGAVLQNRGEEACHLWCNGSEVKSDVSPVISNGRTLVPISSISQALGAEVQWREAERTVLISQGNTQIQLQVENKSALVNGLPTALDVPAGILDSRLMVPLSFCVQAFNMNIAYYPEGKIVAVNQP